LSFRNLPSRFVFDGANPLGEVVRALEGPAPGVESHRLGALGVVGEVPDDREAVLVLDGAAELRLVRRRIRPQSPPRVEEVEDGVRLPGRPHEVAELPASGVVEESLGDDEHRLAAPSRGEGGGHALDHVQGGDGELRRPVVLLRGLGPDEGDAGIDVEVAADRRVLGRRFRDEPVLVPAAGHDGHDLGIAAVVDLHRLPVGEAPRPLVAHLLGLEGGEEGLEVVPAAGHR
jgi:hypothetical protein